MAEIHWLDPVKGPFTRAADWSTGAVPGAGDDAILDAPGSTPYTVTASRNATVNGIDLAWAAHAPMLGKPRAMIA